MHIHTAAPSALPNPNSTCLTTRCAPTSASILSAPMHPVVSLIAEHVVTYHQLFAPLLFSVFATVGNVHTPVQHALLVTAISWLVVWVPAVLRVGIYSHSHGGKRSTSWLAGVLLGFSHICDRAACDNEGIWTSKVGNYIMNEHPHLTEMLRRLFSLSWLSSLRILRY